MKTIRALVCAFALTAACASAQTYIPFPVPARVTTTDFYVFRTSSTVLTIGAATSANPTTWAFGGKVNSLATAPTVTVSSGSGTVYIYATTAGSVIAGYNGFTISCASGCTATSGITAFPDDVIRIATWTSSSGAWASTGTDYRASFNRGPQLVAGTGISITKDEANGTATFAGASAADAPQLICVNGTRASPTSSTTYVSLASCTIPAGTLATNDQIRVRARFAHAGGTAIAPRMEVKFGATASTEVAGAIAAPGYTLLCNVVVNGSSSQAASGWWQQDTTGTPLAITGMTALAETTSGAITVDFLGRMTSATSETVAIEWYTVEVLKAH